MQAHMYAVLSTCAYMFYIFMTTAYFNTTEPSRTYMIKSERAKESSISNLKSTYW